MDPLLKKLHEYAIKPTNILEGDAKNKKYEDMTTDEIYALSKMLNEFVFSNKELILSNLSNPAVKKDLQLISAPCLSLRLDLDLLEQWQDNFPALFKQ
jgi:hypothetical protein